MKRFIKYFGGALSIATMAFAVYAVNPLNADAAIDRNPDCDGYAIIRCGTDSPANVRAEYDSFGTSNSNGFTGRQADIQKIFSALGVSRADLNGTLGNEFQMGVVYQNGDVVVGDKVVARNAKMAARNLGGTAIAGSNAGIVSVSKMGSAQAAIVKFKDGKFVMAVMTPCGNPVSATPVTPPSAKCEGLDKNKISRNEFSFDGRASVKGDAKIKSYTFTVRDSKDNVVATKVVKTDNLKANSGKMTFAKAGTYKVRLTVNSTAGNDLTSADCVKEFTVTPEEKPAVSIDKTVNGKESIVVGTNQLFTYNVVAKNTGNVALKNVAVSDKQPAGVTFVSASTGTIANGMWSSVIPELKIGESKSFTITAKIPTYLAGKIKNTACVDAPAVPGSTDDCDDAYVEVPKPSATCDYVRTNYSSETEFTLTGKATANNGAKITAYVFTTKNSAGAVVDTQTVTTSALQVTTNKVTIETPGTYNVELVVKSSVGDLRSNACKTTVIVPEPKMVRVCDPEIGKIITVLEKDANKYKPVGDPACEPKVVKIKVCELSTKLIIEINEVDFDNSLQTKDLTKCDEAKVNVCDPETGATITVPESEAGDYKPVGDEACEDEEVDVLVDTGVGSVLGLFASVTFAGALAHRMVWVRRNG